ncbi:MAG TPA: MOSC domain-containing protein [Roseiflexaceae bacterium]|nr:MOSC domain-containing protein [Roseiflexaceae bacterium]
MHIISVNVGLPREVLWKGKHVTTGIFKQPVAGRVVARRLNLDGDRQADLTVHGGGEKAVYAYPAEHYDYWRQELSGMKLPWGVFGENLTTWELLEDAVNVGDRFRVGAALLQATQPRLPCYKLGLKFGREDMVRRFSAGARYGWYFAVVEEGELGAGDTIERVHRDPHDITVADIARLYLRERHDVAMMQRAIEHEGLPDGWRAYFQERLEQRGH